MDKESLLSVWLPWTGFLPGIFTRWVWLTSSKSYTHINTNFMFLLLRMMRQDPPVQTWLSRSPQIDLPTLASHVLESNHCNTTPDFSLFLLFFPSPIFRMNYFVCMSVSPACMCLYHMCVWCQKRALGPLELRLLAVVNCSVLAGIWTQNLRLVWQVLYTLSYLLIPEFLLWKLLYKQTNKKNKQTNKKTKTKTKNLGPRTINKDWKITNVERKWTI